MAKDGTLRGGRRARAGAKPMPAFEKLEAGKSVSIMNNNITNDDISDLEGTDLPAHDMPEPSAYLSQKQVDGTYTGADLIYRELWQWLKQRNCENLVNKRLIEAYSQYFARYIQCEEAISKYGLLGKHPTTGGVVASPYVAMSQSYHKQANLIFVQIEDIVKANCTESYSDSPTDNVMEQLLKAR